MDKEIKELDLIIIGAGPAGLTSQYMLQEQN